MSPPMVRRRTTLYLGRGTLSVDLVRRHRHRYFETYDNTGRLQSSRDNIGNTNHVHYSGNRLIR